jgi:hypothetical protein
VPAVRDRRARESSSRVGFGTGEVGQCEHTYRVRFIFKKLSAKWEEERGSLSLTMGSSSREAMRNHPPARVCRCLCDASYVKTVNE